MLGRIVVLLVSLTFLNLAAADGPPAEMGPMDVHALEKLGANQEVLVIYVQADDHRILAPDLAALNAAEDPKTDDFAQWFDEASWGQTTLNVTRQRAAGGEWYVLPEGLLDYAKPAGVRSMEFRDPAQAAAASPTPPASVTALATVPGGSDPTSDFDATEAGDYWYAVAGFKDGVESTLTKLGSAVTVAETEIVKLTITKAAADDVDRYIVYRTGRGQTDNLGNYSRIGYAEVTGASDQYADTGRGLNQLADHYKLLTDAMTVADTDVADFENYAGVIAIIYSPFLRGQAAGAVTYTVNGTSFQIQTINQSTATGFGRYTHEIGHWLSLGEEYDPVTSGTRGYWTTMDGANDRQYQTWEKEFKLGWISTPPNVKFLERPAPGAADFDMTYKVVPTAVEETAADTYTAIKIKSSETVHYYVEGRDAIVGNVSDVTPDNSVVVMEAVDSWPPGIYPKRNLNEQQLLTAGGASHNPDPSVEITFEGVNPGPPESYNVNVKIEALEQPDPRITPWGAPAWESSDIWIDSEREGGGWDDPATAVPKPSNGEAAWVDHVNRAYARITNVGAGDATGVSVRFKVNTPGGIGDAGQFIDLVTPAPVDIPAGESRNVYAEWTPTVESHTCLKAEIEHVPGEADIFNNFAQENVTHFYTGSNSPWQPVTFPVRVANPFKEAKRVFLEIRGLEEGWKARFANKWVDLDAKSIKTVEVTITPPPDAKPCTKLELDVYGMTQIDDYIQIYGGMNPVIHLANPIRFDKLTLTPRRQDPKSNNKASAAVKQYVFSGVTTPAIKEREIAVVVTDPQGNEDVHFATTNDNGAFDTTFPANQPGTWSAYAYYAGDDCNAPTESPPVGVGVPVPGADAVFKFWCCVITIALLLIILLVLLRMSRARKAVT